MKWFAVIWFTAQGPVQIVEVDSLGTCLMLIEGVAQGEVRPEISDFSYCVEILPAGERV